MLAAAGALRTAHRVATYRTLIGLLVVTGMRVGEAIALGRHDFDAEQGLITVRRSGNPANSPSTRASLRCVPLLDAYRQGHDVEARLALLATYLGHIDAKRSYWYLSAAPELMQLAADCLERHLGDRP